MVGDAAAQHARLQVLTTALARLLAVWRLTYHMGAMRGGRDLSVKLSVKGSIHEAVV
jgi:hypothetical protein